MLLSEILAAPANNIKFRRRSWTMTFYLRYNEGKIYIRNTGDIANADNRGLNAKDIIADDWEILQPIANYVFAENQIYVNPQGVNFVYLKGSLYKMVPCDATDEFYRV